jgi:hypothetical protein
MTDDGRAETPTKIQVKIESCCAVAGANLLYSTKHCCKECQKNHWKVHKYNCVGPEVARHQVKEFTIAAIQRAIDAAKPNDVVELHVGTYGAGGVEELIISKPLKIWGPERVGMNGVILKYNVVVKGIPGNTGDVLLTNFQVSGTASLRENSYTNITMYGATVQLAERGSNAMEIGDCKGTVLLLDCEILGGRDTLFISRAPKVHIKGTEIRFASSRDIFANESFVIEDSEVDMCGAYGIKGRAGWIEKGDNDIQPGPWNSFGGAAGGFGY